MKHSVVNSVKASALIALGLAIGLTGFYVGAADDAPGAAVVGLLLMVAAVALGAKTARNRMPVWAVGTAFAVAIPVAAFAALLAQATAAAAPLFAQPADVPSVGAAPPPPQWAGAVDRARQAARAAIAEQNLPGVSVAVGANGDIVWAEGFGWRDVVTQAPVTPSTRFNVGTAAGLVTADGVAAPWMKNSGTESAVEWSPDHIGEPEEDWPGFTLIRDVVLRPMGIARPQPLPGERATFYVPRYDDNPRRGRRLMYMRDLACCAGAMAFYSTPSDLVRFGLANGGSVDGELAGGMVMSLTTRRDNGIVVAVTSNVAHAATSDIARIVGEAFTEPAR
jgi:CubicO group peptidase (beta-lactamase class C family)